MADFDDLGSAAINVPAGYDGFVWGWSVGNPTFSVFPDLHYLGAGNYNNSSGAPSAPNAVSNYAGVVELFRQDGGLFSVQGADFATFMANSQWQSDSASQLTLTAWNGATQVGQTSFALSGPGYNWQALGFNQITRLGFSGSNGGNVPDYATRWMMDNFTYTTQAAAVPEPASALLLLAGLAGLAPSAPRVADANVAGATAHPLAQRLVLEGRRADGAAFQAQAQFFCKGLRVYQVTVIGTRLDPEAVDVFFSSLKLSP